jgi:phosphate transport system permease protein
MSEPPDPNRYFKRVQRNDRIASAGICIGGIGIIGIVIGMLFIIASVALPLFKMPSTSFLAAWTIPQAVNTLGLGIDEYLETGYFIQPDGSIQFFSTGASADEQGMVTVDTSKRLLLDVKRVMPGKISGIKAINTAGALQHTYLWNDGSSALVTVSFAPVFDEKSVRKIAHKIAIKSTWDASDEPIQRTLCRASGDKQVRIDLLENGDLNLSTLVEEENPITEEITRNTSSVRIKHPLAGRITDFTVDTAVLSLYASTDAGQLGHWDLRNLAKPELIDHIEAFEDGRAIQCLNLLLGDISLMVGDEKGGVTSWMPVRTSPEGPLKALTRIHTLRPMANGVVDFISSQRDKTVLSVSDRGAIHGDYLTSERPLFTFTANKTLQHVGYARRGNGLVMLSEAGQFALHQISAPHPETSARTLFGKVHYEGYSEPDLIWQSSSGSDDFEPKLSMVPLVLGTLKGTFYAMLFAAPLAIFGALYTSQFMRASWRNRVKPMIEIMAAVPSVVVGFLGGLWLAPLLEDKIPGVFMFVIILPVMLIIALFVYKATRQYPRIQRLENGYEFLGLVPVVLIAVLASWMIGKGCEQVFFGGDFRQSLYEWMQIRVDQRNCIVISFALGFAVIPVIYTLSDDALMAVPKNLTAASLALGASRWQTAWTVVLPSASPGIFAALMIGLGRAVGETMIVLMATGNTPIMDWSMFNGMRTLSANIAVEIPEAPFNGTLYRTLFLSAVILFMFTFVINSVAEMVRIRLREKFGNY